MKLGGRLFDEARLAFMLLSRLPVGRMERAPPLAACAWAYAVVGAVVGACAGLVFWLAARAGLPPMAAAPMAIGAGALLTGAMHEDGLADLADGFGGGRGKARKLEIMRDSRIGSYGVVALILVLGVRAECMAALPAVGMVARLAVLGAWSRALLPVVMLALPPARADGLGQAAGETVARGPVLVGLMLAAGLALLTGVTGAAPCFVPLAGMALAVLGVALLARWQIGGFTGDVLGAAQVIGETVGLVVLAAAM
ncbi:adenosylcobinamide-GDP ribazoletransferase [Acidocella sp.]|uniref:adenosylcobinamide-GDP ribazoletransferase n=1 Tax=Acidocella sp. TaxID=50710 RepID=UPI003D03F3B9